MNTVVNSRRLEIELIKRGLLPSGVTPSSALVIRYEVFVTSEQLDQYADAMKAAAVLALADDERNRQARAKDGP